MVATMDTKGTTVRGDPLRIAFFGTPEFAVPSLRALIASRHPVVGVVTQPDRPRGRGQRVSDSPVKQTAVEHNLEVLQPDRLRDPAFVSAFAQWAPDLGVVAAYGKLITDDLLRIPRHGMINVHGSLLPKYRGAAPVHRSIMNGETETGITIMRVVKALDAGAMFAKTTRAIAPDETSAEVERDLAQIGAPLLIRVIEQIASASAYEEPQDDRLSTYAPRLTRDEGLIDWTLPAASLHNRVRGLYPWPHAFTYLEGARLIVLKTRVDDTPAIEPPGTIVVVSRDEIAVSTGKGRLALVDVQPEGRRPMRVRDFLAGHPLSAGLCLTAG
jgi:methionyl-tRNA formyltransferase